MREFMNAHRRSVWAAAVLVAIAGVFVVVWFQPHKLFIEATVDEAPPTVRSDGSEPNSSDGQRSPAPKEPSVLAEGVFQGLEHPTSGTARVLDLSDGSRFLRLENLDTSNGPDLRVYLSEIPASDDWYAYGERFIDLGPLKGNRGDQNYEVPAGTDLSAYRSAVIWCRRFTVGFGVAPLM
ncbi:MAG: DM13 domain-containing protein [Actinomycetota bacterium]|nr:DM13 domain-containing protein [Actinomycetota bacterium]